MPCCEGVGCGSAWLTVLHCFDRAGLTSDANILIDLARRVAQTHRFTYGKEAPVEAIVTRVCDVKQGQTQFGGE